MNVTKVLHQNKRTNTKRKFYMCERKRVLLCFGKLNVEYTLPNDLYQQLDSTNITISDDEYSNTEEQMSESSNSKSNNLLGFTSGSINQNESSLENDTNNEINNAILENIVTDQNI